MLRCVFAKGIIVPLFLMNDATATSTMSDGSCAVHLLGVRGYSSKLACSTLDPLFVLHPLDRKHLRWIQQRKAFGKPLSSLAVIRSKMANMIARAESIQSWLENITYQMCHMVSPSSIRLGLTCKTDTHMETVVQGTSTEACWVRTFVLA